MNKIYREYDYPFNLMIEIFRPKEPPEHLSGDMQETLNRILDTLPEQIRIALSRRYQDKMTFPEIGALLGVTGGRAGQLVSKGILLLRHPSRSKQLKGTGNEDIQAETNS